MELKGDESPLTKADTESNRIICEGLQRVSPHVPIISEENKTLPYSIRKVQSAAAHSMYRDVLTSSSSSSSSVPPLLLPATG